MINHQWLTGQGVFGIALGVSTSFVFLFVLFGALLDKAGAGNYFIKVAFSLLGHYKGGPAKAAVVASGMTGLISGSSIANTVTTGTFTIPMMRRVGFPRRKPAPSRCPRRSMADHASRDGGGGLPDGRVCGHFLCRGHQARFPAGVDLLYRLIYIVHLEALKANMQGLESSNPAKPLARKVIGFLGGLLLMMVTALVVYYGLGWLKPVLGDATPWVVALALAAIYVALLKLASGYPELELDDPNEPIYKLPQTRPTVMVGLQYILPVIVLIWCLMVERLSPGLSAFWATVFMIFIMLTQRPITALFRHRSNVGADIREGFLDLWNGLVTGARNMIGIGIATATAGIIVGAVSQTGVGLVLADVVEILSMGNLLLILLFTAVLSLILGMGLPTTANYIVVSALLAPVIVTLGEQNGLLVPLIAVHLFVFYFGIMADVTPPVGLASFAAAAVSGGDPSAPASRLSTTACVRCAAFPVHLQHRPAVDRCLAPSGRVDLRGGDGGDADLRGGDSGFMITRNRWYESILLLLVAFTLFRPGFWMDMIHDPYRSIPPTQFVEALGNVDEDSTLRLQIRGEGPYGDPLTTYMTLPVPDGDSGEERMTNLGLELRTEGDRAVVDMVTFGSQAKELGFDFDQEIIEVQAPVERWTKEWMWIPAFLVFAWWYCCSVGAGIAVATR